VQTPAASAFPLETAHDVFCVSSNGVGFGAGVGIGIRAASDDRLIMNSVSDEINSAGRSFLTSLGAGEGDGVKSTPSMAEELNMLADNGPSINSRFGRGMK
jgi:hypothetical protein